MKQDAITNLSDKLITLSYLPLDETAEKSNNKNYWYFVKNKY